MFYTDQINLDRKIKSLVGIGSSATGSDLIVNDAGASVTDQSTITTAQTIKVSCANVADTSAGTGARTVRLTGVDGSYNEVSEVISLNGQTAVNSANTYLMVTKLEVLTVGSGGTNAGIIYAGIGTITTGVPATQYLQVIAGQGTSRAGFIVVPAGYTLVINGMYINNGTATNASTVKIFSRSSSTTPYLLHTKIVVAGNDTKDFLLKHVVPEKSYLKITGNNVTSTSALTVTVNYYLAQNV